ncbi:hypothetical protein [Paludibaculum fermentans]|uniref:hypothetical protein n=1 Tax=Paludibaculum fermentans TaxID=1473598 RepID=UPI003EBAF417
MKAEALAVSLQGFHGIESLSEMVLKLVFQVRVGTQQRMKSAMAEVEETETNPNTTGTSEIGFQYQVVSLVTREIPELDALDCGMMMVAQDEPGFGLP